jgi:DNA-binding GntR family transcriptional regulator
LAARLFVEQSSDAEINRLENALSAVESAYDSGDAEKMLEAKNTFYEVLLEGARSSTLSNMLDLLHGQVWRWRAMGLTHPQRSALRGRESTGNLRALLQAIKARDAALAENILRDEINEASKEVNRLLQDSARGREMPAAS